MTTRRPVPPRLRHRPFTIADANGQVSPGALRGPRFRRLTRGVYQEMDAVLGVDSKIRAMRLVVPADAVLGGLSAAWALGIPLTRPQDPVELVTGVARRHRAGLLIRRDVLEPDEVVPSAYGPATSPARTAFDLARGLRLPRELARQTERLLRSEPRLLQTPPEHPLGLIGPGAASASARIALVVSRVDAVLKEHDLDASALWAMAERHPGARGIAGARLVATLTDPRADSPPESVLRVRFALAGLPRPVPQFEIVDANGVFVAKPDLGWPDLELGAEYDGAHHDAKLQVRKDKRRDIRGHKVSWRLLHFDADSLRDVPTLILDTHTVMLQQWEALRRP